MAKNINNMGIDCERLIAEIQNRPCIWPFGTHPVKNINSETTYVDATPQGHLLSPSYKSVAKI